MTIAVPAFPWDTRPEDWPDLVLLAATVLLESHDQPPECQLAVASVAVTRTHRRGNAMRVLLFEPFQFPSWLFDYRPTAHQRLRGAAPGAAEQAWKWAAAAMWELRPDPTGGADLFLDVEDARRQSGSLPLWAEQGLAAGQVVKIGRYTFVRSVRETG